MLNAKTFSDVYSESRNGTDSFYRHSLVRKFAYSAGVKELAETGCYWLLDILATELPSLFPAHEQVSDRCIVYIRAIDLKAVLSAEFEDDVVAWTKKIDMTDLPDGEFMLMLANERWGETPFRLILLSEY